MLRQLLTMLAVLSGLAAAPAAAEVRAAEPRTQVAGAAEIAVCADCAAAIGLPLDTAPAALRISVESRRLPAVTSVRAVLVKVDRARE